MRVRFNWLSVAVIFGMSLLTSCLNSEDSQNAQLTADVNTIDQYLQLNPPTDYLLRDSYSGIRFVIHEFGEGLFPTTSKKVKVSYEGRLLSNGLVVDEGNYNGDLAQITPPGLAYAVGSLLEGTNATVYVPSSHAFGTAGTTTIPPNSIIVYSFHTTEVQKTTTETNQWKADTAAIRNHLDEAGLLNQAVEMSNGAFYVVQEQGTGDYPVLFDLVTLNYKMMLLSGTTIDQNTLTQYSLFQLIDGLKSGIPQVRVGTKVTFYIPSLYGYGGSAHGTIPANSVLKFEMTLTSITPHH